MNQNPLDQTLDNIAVLISIRYSPHPKPLSQDGRGAWGEGESGNCYILQRYSLSFSLKVFSEESATEDDLMRVFGLTQLIKAENKQYWGRELGMCWQRVVTEVCRENCEDFRAAIRQGKDELCDLIIGLDAIDTKYRIGSGDAGTLKKFREYAGKLQGLGLTPILLILRTDNLPQAINACRMGGWTVMQGSDAYEYIRNKTGFDLESWLQDRRNRYSIES